MTPLNAKDLRFVQVLTREGGVLASCAHGIPLRSARGAKAGVGTRWQSGSMSAPLDGTLVIDL